MSSSYVPDTKLRAENAVMNTTEEVSVLMDLMVPGQGSTNYSL